MFFKTDYHLVNAGQKYSCILSTFIKLPVVIKTFVLSIYERTFYTGSTVLFSFCQNSKQGQPWSDCFWTSSLIWVCSVCLDLFGRQLRFGNLEHLPWMKTVRSSEKKFIIEMFLPPPTIDVSLKHFLLSKKLSVQKYTNVFGLSMQSSSSHRWR